MTREQDERFMRVAIETARDGMAAGQTPFGACIVRDGAIIAAAHNTVARDGDATCHAETEAIRAACRAVGAPDLSGCVLYATATPCAMCFTAAEIAGIETIHFGVGPEQFRPLFPSTARKLTFRTPTGETASGMTVIAGLLADECLALFEAWAQR